MAVSVITLNYNEIDLAIGARRLLTATVYPESDDSVVWSTSDNTKVIVDGGEIVGVGTTAENQRVTITATCGGKSATCSVSVVSIYKLVTLNEAKQRLSIDFNDMDSDIRLRISAKVGYLENAVGVSERDYANYPKSTQDLAKEYVLSALYYDYYDAMTELNKQRLTQMINQLQYIV